MARRALLVRELGRQRVESPRALLVGSLVSNAQKAPARSTRGARCAFRSLRSLQCLRRPPSSSARPLSVPPEPAAHRHTPPQPTALLIRQESRRLSWLLAVLIPRALRFAASRCSARSPAHATAGCGDVWVYAHILIYAFQGSNGCVPPGLPVFVDRHRARRGGLSAGHRERIGVEREPGRRIVEVRQVLDDELARTQDGVVSGVPVRFDRA